MSSNACKHPCERPLVDINLCAGAGGLALGLAQAGFDPCEFYDKDPIACDTLRYNLSVDNANLKGRVFECDLSKIDWIPSCSDLRLLAAGAPCQPFSSGGSRRGHKDERNLFPVVFSAIRRLLPKAVFIENVRGLERGAHKQYLDYLVEQLRYPYLERRPAETWEDHNRRLRQHGADKRVHPLYRVKWGVFNAADFGVAQIRDRLFIVATASGVPEYRFPDPTHSKQSLLYNQAQGMYWEAHELTPPDVCEMPIFKCGSDRLPWVTVRDATSDLAAPDPKESKDCNNHWAIPGARSYAGHTGSRLDWPSKTLKAGVHGVPGGENTVRCDDGSLRYFTLREMARIQTFPDSHYFTGARSNVTRQIGNAVPCKLAEAIASPLRKLFDEKSTEKEDIRK